MLAAVAFSAERLLLAADWGAAIDDVLRHLGLAAEVSRAYLIRVESDGPGVGVGLTLVRRFAELHGGRAWVEERDGGGASFRVFLPRRTRRISCPSPSAVRSGCGPGGDDRVVRRRAPPARRPRASRPR